MPLYASEQYDDPRAPVAAQDAAAKKARTGSDNPVFDPATPIPATYSADATRPTALNPLGVNRNTDANYLASPSSVDGAQSVARPVPTSNPAPLPPANLAPPVTRPVFNDVSTSMSTALAGAPAGAAGGGSPRAVVNGRVISPDEITKLSNTNVISSDAFRNPGIGTLGIPVSTDQGVQLASQGINRPSATPAFDPQAAIQDGQRRARSNLADILSEDPRSILGSAAYNARVKYSGTGPEGRAAYQNALTALMKQGMDPATAAQEVALQGSRNSSAQALEDTRQAGDNQRAKLNADTQRFDAVLRRPLPAQIRQADGTLGLLGPDSVVRPALNPNGQPISEWIGKPPEEIASLNKAVGERVNTLLGLDPLTGLMTDANGQKRRPTAAEMQAADAAARETFTGGRPGQNPSASTTSRPTVDQFLAAARAAPQNKGKSDDELRAYYKSTYGT